ncbi:MAG TPA: methyltransferase domain-containing protein [Acetobacteraceae bacterium]|nr:methyltransferase domain-containing protein [Acetobacteraceae bacterium]
MTEAPPLAQLRAWYAEELRFAGPIDSEVVVRAFAAVPRERFLGPGPWLSRSDTNRGGGYRVTPDADPRHVYHDVLFALDASRRINNGAPSLWAYALDHVDLSPGERVLHLGCGTGYYSAVMAELVGAGGHVTAVERDADLARRAAEALALWPWVQAVQGDGAQFDGGAQDAIVVSAGATHPPPLWLDALRPGGRLLFPLTSERLGGYMLKVTRGEAHDRLGAGILCRAWFIPFIGARDVALDARLATQIEVGNADLVRSLRRDHHPSDDSCWLHGGGFCLSLLDWQSG